LIMSSERWVILKDGQLYMHSELDGWSAKKGLDPHDDPVTLEELKQEYDKRYYIQALELLLNEARKTT
jgi:hypothetical protein